MSVNWGYYCQACEVETDHWLDHSEEALRQYIIIRTLMKQSKQQFDRLAVQVDNHDWVARDAMAEFFDEHGDHDIVLKNEYDDIKQVKPKEYDW